MSAGDVVLGVVIGLAVAAVVVAAVRWPRRRRRGDRVRPWTSVWLDGQRIVAEGVAADAIVTERFVIMLNGRPVRMMLRHIDHGGGTPRWQAQDVRSYDAAARSHVRVHGGAKA